MAIKYLDAKRLQGTNAERLALTTGEPTFEDNFSSDNWTDTGSGVSITGGALTWSSCAMGADNRVSRSIGTTLDADDWIMRFKFNVSGWNIPNQWVLGCVNTIGNPDATTQDMIGVVVSEDYKLRLATKTDSGAYYNQGATGDVTSAISTDTDYYVELARTSPTNARLRYYANADFTGQIGSDVDVTITSGISGLANLQTGVQSGGSASRTLTATLNNLQIWNGVTTVPSLSYPDLPNGTIFNETDTYKYFMWNGTDTWNQMVSS